MDRESMARLGFAFWLMDYGVDLRPAARVAFSREPDVFAGFTEALSE